VVNAKYCYLWLLRMFFVHCPVSYHLLAK